MIALLQRVLEARVSVEEVTIGKIGPGLVIFLGVEKGDSEKESEFLVQKITGFRIFNDSDGKMNRSIQDVGGSALVISQFTLCGDWRKGRRPSFINAADPALGEELYNAFIAGLEENDIPVQSGQFGAMMAVTLVNDGPVTFVLDTNK
ncbi:MAG: D-aminoacyl-tRNA deacylase [Fidelibacterota bacterium]